MAAAAAAATAAAQDGTDDVDTSRQRPAAEQRPLWLSAWRDHLAGLKTISPCMELCDLNGDNDYKLVVVKVKGEFVWHKHDHEDEMFLVVDGEFRMELRDGNIDLQICERHYFARGLNLNPVRLRQPMHLIAAQFAVEEFVIGSESAESFHSSKQYLSC